VASKRAQILLAIKTQLKTIAQSGGYNSTVKKVSYGYIPLSKVSVYPTVCLIPLDGVFAVLTNNEYTSGSGRNSLDGWPIAVISYVQNKKGEEKLSDSRENMIEDIIKCMFVDRHLGLPAFVHTVYYVSCEGTLDMEDSIATISQIFSVKYDFDISAP